MMRLFACAAVLVLVPCLARAQEPTVAVPANIKVEGMPPIPQSIADGLAKYSKFREAQMLGWHPTRRQILIMSTLGDAPQLYTVDAPGRAPAALTSLPQPGVLRLPNLFAAFDPADPNTLVFPRVQNGAQSLYRYDLTTSQASLVADTQSRYYAVWSRRGSWLAYDSAERNKTDHDLYVMRPADPKSARRIAEVTGLWAPEDWSPDGTMVLASELVSNFERYIWVINVKTGEKKAITPRDGNSIAWFDPRFSVDGKKVYAISDKGDRARVWRCDLATGAWTPVTSDSDRIDTTTPSPGFELSSDGQMIAVLVDRGSTNELQLIDLGTMKKRPMPALPAGVVSQLRWRPGSREIAFSLATIRSPGDVYSIDTSLATLSRWTTGDPGSFNPDGVLPPPETVEWKSSDGVVFSGAFYKPAARFTGPRPVVIQLHGGPDARDRVRFLGRSNYLLNDLGVAILLPNVRGSSGFGRAFELLDNGRGRDGAIKDVGTVLDWIATRQDLDKTRVVLLGVSYGGWLAVESGIVYNDRIRGIIEGAGQTNFITYLEQTEAARQENRRQEFGDERDPEMRNYLLSISPITRASDLKKPTYILHPGKDVRVPVSQAQELVTALKGNHATVWYAEFVEATHETFPGSAAGNDFMLASWMWFFKNFVLN